MKIDLSKLTSFDVETGGELDEYALQPWRANKPGCTAQAWINTSAIAWREAGEGRGSKIKSKSWRKPTREQHAQLLRWAAENDRVLVGWNMTFDVAWLVAQGLEAEVEACRFLDAMLLWQHLEREPEYELPGSKKRPWSLKEAVRQFIPGQGGYEDDVNYAPTTEAQWRRLLHYNELDCQFTLVLALKFYQELKKRSKQQLRNALIEATAIVPVAQSIVRGLVVNEPAVDQLQDSMDKEIYTLKTELALAGATDKVLASPIQLRNLLYEDWGLPVPKLTDKGAPSTDKEALYLLAAADPRAERIKRYRELTGNRTKFVTNVRNSAEYNGDGTTHPSMRIYGTYCVPGDTEVLTRDGWVPIREWDGGEIVQCTPGGSAEFKYASRFDGPVVSDWVSVTHRRLTARFTYGHTIPYYDQAGSWKSMSADKMLTRHHQDLPVATTLFDAFEPAAITRVIVAALADGWFNPEKGTWRWTLKKDRKKARLESILSDAGVQYRKYVCDAYPERTEYTVNKRTMPVWLKGVTKEMGPWVLQHDPAVWVDESQYWDGSQTDGGFKVTYKDRENARWLATLAALAGQKGSVHAQETQKHGGFTTSAHVSKQRPIVCVSSKDVGAVVTEPEQCFCPETETGYWLARSGDHIFVTGNTGRATFASKQGRNKGERQTGFAIHQMKNDPDYRRAIKAPPGFKMVEWDAAGQEYRWMAVESGDETMLSLCQPGEDPHGFMGASIGHEPYEWMLLNKNTDPRAKQMRKMGKVGNLSCQFRIGYKKLYTQAHVQFGMPISMDEAQHIHATYHATYPGVKQYWKRKIAEARRKGYAETLAGRRVQLASGWNDRNLGWKLESTAVNFPIQGVGADQKYLAIMVLQNYLRQCGGYFYFELHDGLYAILPEHNAMKAGKRIQKALSNLPYQQAWGFTPPIPLPFDMKIGDNWGDLKEV